MWKFAEISVWQVSSAPKHDKFFSSDNRSIVHSLVREVSQNSGDAAANGGPVELRFRFLEVDAALMRGRYLEGLADHLAAVATYNPGITPALRRIEQEQRVCVLLIEDFGTTGLTGTFDNPRAKGNFNSFWRRFGQSEKGDAKGGRHGVGKSTIASASAIKTVFGATIRYDDDQRLLYGQATLRPHELSDADVLFDSYGVFASTAPPDPPLPFVGKDVDTFAEAFGLKRRSEPGLSLVVPLPVEELTPTALTNAAVEHCFHQVLSGALVIEVDGLRIDRDSLEGLVASRPELAHLAGAVALSQEAIAGNLLAFDAASDRSERLDESEFDSDTLRRMRERWFAGETVAVRLTVPAIRPRKEGGKHIGEAMLYMRKVEDHRQAAETYIRGRLLVPERRLTGRDCLSLLLAKDGPLSTMLGDSEQPSHTRWVQADLKDLYFAPEVPFRRARNALVDLEKILVGAKEGEALPDLLKSFFFTPSTGKADKAPGPAPIAPLPPTEPALEIRKIEGGFVAELKKEAKPLAFVALDLRYLVRKGRPKFRKDDFDLTSGTIKITVEAGRAEVVKRATTGRIELKDIKPGFRMRVTGFDRNRDLFVHAAPSTEDQANEVNA